MRRFHPRLAALLIAVAILNQLDATPAPQPAPDDAARRQIATLIAALHSDHVRGNAEHALDALTNAGPGAFAQLHEALLSDDHQQRQMAAAALVSAGDAWRDHPTDVTPTPALVRVLIEGLRHDDLPSGRDGDELRYNDVFNARRATEYLARHVELAEGPLVDAMHSDDGQQQFLAACLLGWAGRSDHASTIAAILLPHLRDNTLDSDALLAAPALYRLGKAIEPMLHEAMAKADRQQQRYLELIQLDLTDPPTTGAKLVARHHRYHFCDFCYDPVYQFSVDRLYQYPFVWPRGMRHVAVR